MVSRSSFPSIPLPCQQNWEHMKPNANGRFCEHCKKTVIDFTGMSAHEVESYYAEHISEYLCGYFKHNQLFPDSPDQYGMVGSLDLDYLNGFSEDV